VAASLPSRVAVAPDIVFQDLKSETILLNLNNERYYGLDDVGTRMWQVLSEQGEVEVAIAQLAAEYDVDEATLRQDVAELIDNLGRAGLIVIQE
jgi:hypothetical protein